MSNDTQQLLIWAVAIITNFVILGAGFFAVYCLVERLP